MDRDLSIEQLEPEELPRIQPYVISDKHRPPSSPAVCESYHFPPVQIKMNE